MEIHSSQKTPEFSLEASISARDMQSYSILRLAGDKRLDPVMHGPLTTREISHIFGRDKN